MKTKFDPYQQIQNFCSNYTFGNCDLLEFIDIDELIEQTDETTDANDLYHFCHEKVYEQQGFEVEIIYYRKAIEYLLKNDPSLYESLEYAHDLGFTLTNLNSETLASIHASHEAQAEFDDQIEDFEELLELINNYKSQQENED
jgi:tetratricopeptide (TPR) repeat protein